MLLVMITSQTVLITEEYATSYWNEEIEYISNETGAAPTGVEKMYCILCR